MAALEKVMQMKNQGFSEQQILDSLRKEGTPPREIMEAISQSNIKSEITTNPQQQVPEIPQNPNFQQQFPQQPSMPQQQFPQQQTQPPQQSQMPPQQFPQQQTQPPQQPPQATQGIPEQKGMKPSIMEQNSSLLPQTIPSQTQQISSSYQPQTMPLQEYTPEPSHEQYPPVQDFTTAQTAAYPESGEYYPEYQAQSYSDVETMNDIAEQIVEEKNLELKKQISNFTKFREEAAIVLEKLNKRLTKIENEFNDLQMAIIKKIGDYGKDVQSISKEMRATQESFSKIIDPLTENIRELRRITKEK